MFTRILHVVFVLVGAFACVGAVAHAPSRDRDARCAALFRGKRCQLEKTTPACLKRVFSGTWLTLHVNGAYGVEGSRAAGDPWLKGFRHQDGNLSSLPLADALNLTAPLNSRRAATLRSCALVGSGSELTGSHLGSVIDKHDVVVRLNRAPVKGFERDVGSFTTLRYTNNFNEGFREFDTEAVVASKWCSSGPPCDFYEAVRRLGDKKVHALNPAFVAYARRDTFAADVGHNPSSGFAATLLLLHVCNSVDIYGFSVFQDDPRMKRWYYNHDRRSSPHREVFGGTSLRSIPPQSPNHRQDAQLSFENTQSTPDESTTSGEAGAGKSRSHAWPTYDKLWWNINRWQYVIPNSEVRYSKVASDSSVDDSRVENSFSSPPSTKRSRVSPARNVLAQSLFIGDEKLCLRSLHAYGLVRATDGSMQRQTADV